MAFQKAIRSNVFEHKNEGGDIVALSVEFKVWDNVINPFEAGDGNDNCRLIEVYVTPEEYDRINSTGTAAEKKTAIRALVKGKLREKFLVMSGGYRVHTVKTSSAATLLLGPDTIGDLG